MSNNKKKDMSFFFFFFKKTKISMGWSDSYAPRAIKQKIRTNTLTTQDQNIIGPSLLSLGYLPC